MPLPHPPPRAENPLFSLIPIVSITFFIPVLFLLKYNKGDLRHYTIRWRISESRGLA
jgi:hypothetical protein